MPFAEVLVQIWFKVSTTLSGALLSLFNALRKMQSGVVMMDLCTGTESMIGHSLQPSRSDYAKAC